MLKLTVTITGDTMSDLVLGLSEVEDKVDADFTSGSDRNESGSYEFNVERFIPESEVDAAYYDYLGNEVSYTDIEDSYARGDATLICGHSLPAPGVSVGLSLDYQELDTRNQCESVWEEKWTSKPVSLQECLDTARSR